MEECLKNDIIIISESKDTSTNRVLEWLFFYKNEFIRKNVDTDFINFAIQISNQKAKTSFTDYIIWNRRGYLPLIPACLRQSIWNNYLKKEQLPVLFALENLNQENYIGSYIQELNNNKILNLQKAKEVGIEIPSTLVTNNKNDLVRFIEKEKRYISKCIYHSPSLETLDSYYFGNGTIEFEIENIPETFSPSLVQEYIEKEIEIRVFFIEENFYSMAIFSQNDEQTKLDFKNYNKEKPNRNVPFNLPNSILKKLKSFAKTLDCKTGSIDLILTTKGEYVFLEINPMGQYDWLSQNCNYYIDKEIAEILINKLN